jgi:hypothetical protein
MGVTDSPASPSNQSQPPQPLLVHQKQHTRLYMYVSSSMTKTVRFNSKLSAKRSVVRSIKLLRKQAHPATQATRTVAPTLLGGCSVMLFAWTSCPESPNSRMRFLRSLMLLQGRRRSLAHCCNTTKSTSVSATITMVVMDFMHQWLPLEKTIFQSNTDSIF